MMESGEVLMAMVGRFVVESRREGGSALMLAGMSTMLVCAVEAAYGCDVDEATERAGDMINDYLCGMD